MLSLLEDVERYVCVVDILGDPYIHVYEIAAEEIHAASQKSTTKRFQIYEPYGHERVRQDSRARMWITQYKKSIPRDTLEELTTPDACAA
jgi:hypothetical protein